MLRVSIRLEKFSISFSQVKRAYFKGSEYIFTWISRSKAIEYVSLAALEGSQTGFGWFTTKKGNNICKYLNGTKVHDLPLDLI